MSGMPETHPVLSDRAQSRLRTAGLLLLLAGSSVSTVAGLVTHWRARMMEQQSQMLRTVSSPGSMVTAAGIALLEMSSNIDR
jgi:hypothetical protein